MQLAASYYSASRNREAEDRNAAFLFLRLMLVFGLCLLSVWIQLLVLGAIVLGRRHVESARTKQPTGVPSCCV